MPKLRKPDEEIGPPDNVYLQRWWLIRNFAYRVYLHCFLRSDDDRALHDHPADNISIILIGSYREHLPGGVVKLRKAWRPWAPWRVYGRRAEAAHRVELIDGKPVWTLFIRGPGRREWGFHCPRGWIPWTDFVDARPGGNAVGNGCGD